MKPRLTRRHGLLLLGGLAALGLGLVLLRASPLAPVAQVGTVDAARGTLRASLFGIGVVESRRSILIGPTSAGRVARVHVEQGEVVKAGQLLAEMDPVDLRQRLLASRHALARAGAAVKRREGQVHADCSFGSWGRVTTAHGR